MAWLGLQLHVCTKSTPEVVGVPKIVNVDQSSSRRVAKTSKQQTSPGRNLGFEPHSIYNEQKFGNRMLVKLTRKSI